MPIARETFAEESPDGARKKSALPWIIGCAVAVVVLPMLVGTVGLLAAIAIPAFVQARNRARLEICLTNLRNINRAKEMTAMQNAYTNGTPVTMADLSEFLAADGTPTCPQGGTYAVNPIGADATCSGHEVRVLSGH